MTGYKRVNYYELCRLCTSSQPKDKIHIFREEGRKMQLQQKIQSCFPLLVCEHDYLPKVVCTSCIQSLEQCYAFRQNCINSETMLSSYFSNFRFTDDFKKAGKVYVKDTGQEKLENIQVQTPQNQTKKLPQENLITTNIQPDPNQQFFTLELPAVPNYPSKIQNEFVNINQNIKQPETIKYNLKNQNDNLVTCNITPLNINFNNKNDQNPLKTNDNFNKCNNFDAKLNNNVDLLQPMMLIDVEQLIESGLPEKDSTKQILSNSKHFKCELCNKIFKRREHLYQHSKLHSGLRPFNCVHCPKTFSRKEHLMRHLTSHSGVKDFTCDVCSKKFSRPDNLKKHKKTHQKSGPFVCEICQKSFVIKHYYIAHKLQHHDNDPIISNMLKIEEEHVVYPDNNVINK